MVAKCESTQITVGVTDADEITYNKENIAIAIVVIDLIVSFYFWVCLLIVRPIEKVVT